MRHVWTVDEVRRRKLTIQLVHRFLFASVQVPGGVWHRAVLEGLVWMTICGRQIRRSACWNEPRITTVPTQGRKCLVCSK